MSKLKKLRNSIDKKCSTEDFENVNKCINDMISGKSENDAIKEIKSLICHLEGEINKSTFYAIATIGYAVIIGAISVFCNMNDASSIYTIIMALIMVCVAVVLVIVSLYCSKSDYKNTFILKVLYFKLDELNNENESSAETSITNETNIINGANTANNPDETKKNKKYTPYNFDEKIEYKIYENIMERYNREFLGKKTKVHKEYPDFDKYTEWKTYFESKFLNGISNNCDFKHYLNDRLRIYQSLVDISKSVVTPICIAVITLVLTIYATSGFSFIALLSSLLVGIIIIMIYLMYLVWEHGKMVNFFEDCINIIDSKESGFQ